jgi:hypothetical protein
LVKYHSYESKGGKDGIEKGVVFGKTAQYGLKRLFNPGKGQQAVENAVEEPEQSQYDVI